MRIRIFCKLLAAGLLPLLLGPQPAWSQGAATDNETRVQAMYLAYYGRPADPRGLDFWVGKLEKAGGELKEIIEHFGNSEEYIERFGELNNRQLVDNIYQQLFGRDADPQGRNFYVGQLDNGDRSLASIALDIYNGVRNKDAVIVANKLGVAHAFTDQVRDTDFSYGEEHIADARAILSEIDETGASVNQAEQLLDQFFGGSGEDNCSQYQGSFERIQTLVFDAYNCTNSACHGGNPSNGLDLRPEVAYRNLFRVEATANLTEPLQLVYPGEQALSFLYLKLAAATLGTALPAGGGSPMPIGAGPLTENHLEALRLWIRGGAPEHEDVDEVASLLGCKHSTPRRANKISPPAPPAPGEGVQFVSGPWTVHANSENEVCYATYYDLEQQPGALHEAALTPCEGGQYSDYDGSCFATNTQVLTQDPQSHHSIIDVYVGKTSPLDPSWGEWQCLNGPHQGSPCDPTRIGIAVEQGGADCGGELLVCGTVAQKSTACIGWGAPDHRRNSVSMGGAQSPISSSNRVEGVYSVLPSRGVIIWNSHAFNLSTQDTTIEQYNSFWFAGPEQRQYRNRAIFDSKDIFAANVPPYEQRTYCSTFTLPRGARLTQLGSHAHQRNVLWQTWLPPQDPACTVAAGCAPNTDPADYLSRIYNDPLVLNYDPPLPYDSTDAMERTIKFCVTYDNGKEYPELLKRNSTSIGSRCVNDAYCAGGATPGEYCGADDSLCGDGGVCDACVVRGGVTTEDEMFILLGNYYLQPLQ